MDTQIIFVENAFLELHPRHLASLYLFQYIVHHSLIHSLFNKSFTSTFSKSEIRIKVSKSGWQVFVHHSDNVNTLAKIR